jgi:hypothetical protein
MDWMDGLESFRWQGPGQMLFTDKVNAVTRELLKALIDKKALIAGSGRILTILFEFAKESQDKFRGDMLDP